MSRSSRLADVWPNQVRQNTRDGAVEDRRERSGRGVRVVLSELQRRHRNARLPTFAVLFAEFRQGLLGTLGLPRGAPARARGVGAGYAAAVPAPGVRSTCGAARRPASRSAAWKDTSCARLGLVFRGGRLGFLDSLIGDRMSLDGTAQLDELVSHDSGFGEEPARPRTDGLANMRRFAALPWRGGLLRHLTSVWMACGAVPGALAREQCLRRKVRDQRQERREERRGTLAPRTTACALSSLSSLRTRTPIASRATPESFREVAAASPDTSSLKIAKTTVLFDRVQARGPGPGAIAAPGWPGAERGASQPAAVLTSLHDPILSHCSCSTSPSLAAGSSWTSCAERCRLSPRGRSCGPFPCSPDTCF